MALDTVRPLAGVMIKASLSTLYGALIQIRTEFRDFR